MGLVADSSAFFTLLERSFVVTRLHSINPSHLSRPLVCSGIWGHRLRLVQTKIEEAMRGQNVSALRSALSEGQVASGQKAWTLPFTALGHNLFVLHAYIVCIRMHML